jgi:hypothetical protein
VSLWLITPAGAAADEPSAGARKVGSFQVFATAFVGDGIRFNNPYRLAAVLGSDARSLSRTAAYGDLGAAIAFGDPAHVTNGISLRASMALEGVHQAVWTASYLIFRRASAWAVYARAGLPIVVSPDVTWGFEGAAGSVWFARAGMGIAAELLGDVFYGAGTREVATPAYPVLSAQAGIWLSWEAMP